MPDHPSDPQKRPGLRPAAAALVLSLASYLLPALTLYWPLLDRMASFSGVGLLVACTRALVSDPALFMTSLFLFLSPFLLHLIGAIAFCLRAWPTCGRLLLLSGAHRLTVTIIFVLRSSAWFGAGWWLGLGGMVLCGLQCLRFPRPRRPYDI